MFLQLAIVALLVLLTSFVVTADFDMAKSGPHVPVAWPDPSAASQARFRFGAPLDCQSVFQLGQDDSSHVQVFDRTTTDGSYHITY